MEGVSSSAAGGSSSAAAVQGGRGREPGPGRVGATNIGRLRQGKQQHATRPGVGAISVTSWHLRVFAAVVALMGCLLLAASLAMSALHQVQFRNAAISRNFRGLQELKQSIVRREPVEQIMHARLLQMATSALTKNGSESEDFALWEEPYKQARKWKPCAAKHSLADEDPDDETNNGFVLVSANGGLNQQRVAVCNAVVVAALLNATLVVPRFLYSSVWKDTSQFGDIYQEDYFVKYMKNDVRIVKELPARLRSLDLEAIGSQITDMEISKEADPSEFVKSILPILEQNGVVHFLGFGNRLGFDSVPVHLQRLRCRCNFHALKFVPELQRAGSVLVQRLRQVGGMQTEMDKQLFGNNMLDQAFAEKDDGADTGTGTATPNRYLALHMRFEEDMVAYSLCEFGGGEEERRELQAYRETHFPTLALRSRNTTVSPEEQRSLGRCPLTPEEAGLVLSALGYDRRTFIYVAGSQIYGGTPRLRPLTRLYPNLVTKEDTLTADELAPFKNFSSRLAALDFIACASADVFAVTDSGSQLSSLVSGYRIYHGRGRAPTLHPNRKRYAQVLSEEGSIAWGGFQKRVRQMVDEYKRVSPRPRGRSVYRQPRTPGCMCRAGGDGSVHF
ncbi:growth regulator [Zea mays]|uniref:O-fucosyltransferase family protein n=1 Tax=Zea mays TaxID=4577 RepID=B4FG68_MAIZE|nr:growth regulator [Zea mays]ACF81111.1 unknown [Zea mays]AQL03799.1 O-fucosyltransferase family protein [Zea mays]|eukprot:NP_001132314.1 growth regulator [Zea mays]